jgi:hypothetical protein
LVITGDNNMPGKNRDYRQGYDIGEYLAVEGEEEYDFKDLDQAADELLGELDYSDLPVQDVESFKDGLANGYIITSQVNDDEDE